MFNRELLVSLRDAQKLTQRELAELAGVPSGTIQTIESGHVFEPRNSTMQKIAKVLGVDYRLFYADNDCNLNQAAS